MSGDAAYLEYRLRWRSGESRNGKHAARHSGVGGDFRAIRPFWQLPDAQRIDIRRSIVDPFGEVMVRQTEQRSSITVVLAIDVSRSMQPATGRCAFGALAGLAEAAARSALRAGDSFGLVAFDRRVRADLSLPPTRSRGAARQMAAALAGFSADGCGAEGIGALAAHVPARRCLLLLASDFLMPLGLLDAALTALSRHDVAPIVLDLDSAARVPRAGLLRLRDVETGQAGLVAMRPALHRRWREAAAAQKDARDRLFARHGRPAFYAGGAIDIAALSDHLMAG